MALQPDVGDILSDAAIGAMNFTVKRYSGAWNKGEFEESSSVISFACRGSIQPCGRESLNQIPEGDRTQGSIIIRTRSDLREKDEITLCENRYRVVAVDRWNAYGWCAAVAVLINARSSAQEG